MRLRVICNSCDLVAFEVEGESPLRIKEKYPFYCETCELDLRTTKYPLRHRGHDVRIALVNIKGGVGKTTSAVYLAAALHAQGRTLVIDADPQQSAFRWSEQWAADEPERDAFSVVCCPSTELHRRMRDLGRGYEHIVIDTPPGLTDVPIIKSAVKAVDLVAIPVAATGLDVDRLKPTWQLLREIEDDHEFLAAVLLTRYRRGTLAARHIRSVLAPYDYPILDTVIPLSESYAGSFGTYPGRSSLGAYADLMGELKS